MFAHDDVVTQRSKLEEPLFAGQVCVRWCGRAFVLLVSPCSSSQSKQLVVTKLLWKDEYI